MPGMMETVLNVGLNDESVAGLARQSDDERFALDSYRRLLQMFGATVLGIDGEHFADALDEAKRERGTDSDLDLDADDLARPGGDVQEDRRGAGRSAVPTGPPRAARPRGPGRLRLLEHRPGPALPPPGADPRGPRHGRQRPGDGVRQLRDGLRLRRRLHPRPGQRRPGCLRRLPPERPGRGRRRRHPQHRLPGRLRGGRPGLLRRPDGDHDPPRTALPRHVRHRVHGGARQAVDAADPGREAYAGGRLPDRGPHGRRGSDRPRRGRAARHRRPAGAADVPALRRDGRADPARHRHERLPGRGRRQGGLRLRHRRRVGRARRRRDPRPQGDQPRRPARHGGGPRDPHQPRRQDLSRRRRRARHGPHLRVRGRGPRRGCQGQAVHGARRRHRRARAT